MWICLETFHPQATSFVLWKTEWKLPWSQRWNREVNRVQHAHWFSSSVHSIVALWGLLKAKESASQRESMLCNNNHHPNDLHYLGVSSSSWEGTPIARWMVTIFHGKSQSKKWMMTRGTLMTSESSIFSAEFFRSGASKMTSVQLARWCFHLLGCWECHPKPDL